MFPLARAALDAGHEVRFGSGASVTDRIRRAGFAADDVGPPGMPEMFEALAARIGGEPGVGLAPEEILQWFFPNLFAATVAPLVIGDLLDLVVRWRPDLLVHDTAALAGPLAAAIAHIPSAQHSIGLLLPAEVYRLGEQAVAPLWERHGLGVEPMGGSFRGPCLSIAPPDLETPVDPRFSHQIRRLRPVGFSATADESLPDWVTDLSQRPTVYVTLGTFLNSDRSVFRAALDGLSNEEINVIVTVGRNHPADWLDPVPPNARVEQYIAQSELLPHCDALVSHGGSGTLLPALGAGLPQVLVPQGADNFLNAERCEAAGVGRVLRPGAVTPAAVLEAVRSVLDERSYQDAAGRLAVQINGMPGPDEVVAGLAS
ncbi:MAG: glycosyltransferase [Actinomycetota bacterium]|nr:glycosyltransferase [Actinomycetota bacterium]